MSWELLIHAPDAGLGWVQWVNLPVADAWRLKCRALTGAAPPDAAIVENLDAQAAAVVALFEAVSGWCLACNLPATVFVPWARAVLVTSPNTWRPSLIQALQRFSPDYRDNASETVVEVSRRISLTNASAVDARWLRSPVAPSPTQGLDFSRSGYDAISQTLWGAWVWSEWYPGALSADHTGRVFGLTPLRELYVTALAMAGYIGGRTTEEAIDGCRNYAAAKNLQTARRIAPNALPSEVGSLLVQTRSDDELLNTRVSSSITTVAAIGGAAAAALGPLAPMAALVAGVLSGIGGALQAAFGTAVGFDVDAFGRREPVLESTSISGSLAPRVAPSHAVPVPALLLLNLPGFVQTDGGGAPNPPDVEGGSKSLTGSEGKGSSGAGAGVSTGVKVAGVAILLWLASNSGRKG